MKFISTITLLLFFVNSKFLPRCLNKRQEIGSFGRNRLNWQPSHTFAFTNKYIATHTWRKFVYYTHSRTCVHTCIFFLWSIIYTLFSYSVQCLDSWLDFPIQLMPTYSFHNERVYFWCGSHIQYWLWALTTTCNFPSHSNDICVSQSLWVMQ